MIIWHNHHIVPKHMGGNDDSKNILRCNIAMHAFLHKQLWQEHEHWEDKLAYESLLGLKITPNPGMIGKKHTAASKLKMKRIQDDRVRRGLNNLMKENGGGEMQRQAVIQTNKRSFANGEHSFLKLNTTRITCPHCNKIGTIPGMKRYHFDHCKEKNDAQLYMS